jgi:hypothetical protein
LTRDAVPRGVHLVRGSALVLHLPCQSVWAPIPSRADRQRAGVGVAPAAWRSSLWCLPNQPWQSMTPG